MSSPIAIHYCVWSHSFWRKYVSAVLNQFDDWPQYVQWISPILCPWATIWPMFKSVLTISNLPLQFGSCLSHSPTPSLSISMQRRIFSPVKKVTFVAIYSNYWSVSCSRWIPESAIEWRIVYGWTSYRWNVKWSCKYIKKISDGHFIKNSSKLSVRFKQNF